MTHPYFAERAAEVFAAAGGDPAVSGRLAEWAEAARRRDDVEGVLVAQDGSIIGDTLRSAPAHRAQPAHVSADVARRYRLDRTAADSAAAAIGRQIGQPVIHLTRSQLTMGAGRPPASTMTGIEFRSILEAVGYSDDDAARHLSKSRSMIQKMKSGSAPVPVPVADAVTALHADFHEALDAVIDAAPAEIAVWRDDESSWEHTGRPARWHRIIAAECHSEHGTRITLHPS